MESKGKTIIQYGITTEKQNKYNNRIDEIIADYTQNKDTELLRHRILAFASRTVYVSKEYNHVVWKVKGFINNYGNLRYLIGTNLLHHDTIDFLKNMIKNAFLRNKEPFPYFLEKFRNNQGYSLWYNMMTNKTLLLVEHIGYDKTGLEKLCSEIGIVVSGKGYGNLVREYLMKTKIGY